MTVDQAMMLLADRDVLHRGTKSISTKELAQVRQPNGKYKVRLADGRLVDGVVTGKSRCQMLNEKKQARLAAEKQPKTRKGTPKQNPRRG